MADRRRSLFVRVSVEDIDKAVADLRRLGADGQRSLARLEQASTAPTKGLATLDRGVSGLSGSLRSLGQTSAFITGPLGGVASRFSVLASLIGQTNIAVAALVLGLGGLGFVFGKSIRAASDYERELLKLEGVLKATGGASGRTLGQLDRLAIDIGEKTLESAEGARQAAAALLTFKSVSGETFDRTLRLAADLAALGFGSLQSAAVQLGKALEDPVRQMSALRRVGVSFTATQEELIKNLVATGDLEQSIPVRSADDMMIIRGVNVFPSSIEQILHSFPEVIEYRITDFTAPDEDGRFWAINYLYDGDKDKLDPAADQIAREFGRGESHLQSEHVERLVEFQYTENGIIRTGTPPIQLQFLADGKARNWEGIVRLDDIGFLLMTDKRLERFWAHDLAYGPKSSSELTTSAA